MVSTVFFADRNLGKQFPSILIDAGLRVERHDDHFGPGTPDVEWIPVVAGRGWVAISHDERIRYKPNEKAAVLTHGLGLLLVAGKAPFPELARQFLRTLPRVERFLAAHHPPFIAKVRRAAPRELARDPDASGTVELLLP